MSLLPAAATMDSPAWRDHAPPLLEAMVADLSTSQTPEAQSQRAWGSAPQVAGAPHTAAQTHAILRREAVLTSTSWSPHTASCAPVCCGCEWPIASLTWPI
ncbi:hypothetical protein J2W46_005906 [Paraburkholderia strydomiana]|nr:hypothetical protein [Paraburkholderia strydomiana]